MAVCEWRCTHVHCLLRFSLQRLGVSLSQHAWLQHDSMSEALPNLRARGVWTLPLPLRWACGLSANAPTLDLWSGDSGKEP